VWALPCKCSAPVFGSTHCFTIPLGLHGHACTHAPTAHAGFNSDSDDSYSWSGLRAQAEAILMDQHVQACRPAPLACVACLSCTYLFNPAAHFLLVLAGPAQGPHSSCNPSEPAAEDDEEGVCLQDQQVTNSDWDGMMSKRRRTATRRPSLSSRTMPPCSTAARNRRHMRGHPAYSPCWIVPCVPGAR
jgi:hypothetical protein